ncbi:MAG TPA: lamin tail domain-containing protein, partial [Verrucomicrobiota bacterium]|nr:lamin tail domain-containing protein [Verrucomicrobiota bacterium]
MRPIPLLLTAGVAVLLLAPAPALHAAVVVNEVMYHPPSDRDDLQFIELHNTGPEAVDLAGWKFTKGVECELPAGLIPAGGFAVVCRDPKAFRRHYGSNVLAVANFEGRLKHGGERLRLERPDGSIADTFKYLDRSPWPLGPDGYGASLERRVPGAASDDPANWGGSALPKARVAGGTPGATNSNSAAHVPPQVDTVQFSPVVPEQPITVTAQVTSAVGIRDVRVHWRSIQDRN